MKQPPIGGAEQLIATTAELKRLEVTRLFWIGFLTAIFSGLGFVEMFDAPTAETYMLAVLFGIGVWVIASMFWGGVAIMPEYITGNLVLPFVIFSLTAFIMFATVSFFGNQRIIASATSETISQREAADGLANARDAAGLFWRQLDPIVADVSSRAAQMGQAASNEAAGTGPTGQGGRGPVYRSFIAGENIYIVAAQNLVQKQESVFALLDDADELLAELNRILADTSLDKQSRRNAVASASNKVRGTLNAIIGLNLPGTIRLAKGAIAEGVPPQSGARASSAQRIAEISERMRRHASQLGARADALEAQTPEVPPAATPSQEEHLMANILRMPGLSLAALLFDACGFIIIGFRAFACQVYRNRMREREPSAMDDFITRKDLERFVKMTRYVTDARREMEEGDVDDTPRLPKPEEEPDEQLGAGDKSDG